MRNEWQERRARMEEIRHAMKQLVDESEEIFEALGPVTYERQRDSISDALSGALAATQAIESLCAMVAEHPEMLRGEAGE